MIQKLCKNCSTAFTSWNGIGKLCPKCYYVEHAKPRKPIKKIGPKTLRWIKTRKHWLDNHPPDKSGGYVCYICGQWKPAKQITLDHVKSRSRRPDLIFKEDNLRPCCWPCNQAKGSRSLT